jgi:hypothetical protein
MLSDFHKAVARRVLATRPDGICVALGAAFAGAILVSACTSEGVLRPDVDVGARTAALSSADLPMPVEAVPEFAPQPTDTVPDYASQSQPDLASRQPRTLSEQADAIEQQAGTDPDLASQSVDLATGEPAPAPVYGASVDQPAPSNDIVVEPEPVPQTRVAAAIPGPGLQRLVPSNPYLTGYPRLDAPERPRALPPSAMPADEVACRRELKRLGVKYRDLAPIHDSKSCRIDYPVSMSGLSGGIKMKPAATLNCEMAAIFARWTKNELAPAARYRYLSGVKTIHQGSSYSCRRINGSRTSSEHSRGNALDVMRIELKNGRDIDVKKPGWFAFRQRGFLNTVRADGCEYFTTVLGPGYNYDHRNHFHFDIKPRRNGYRACR